MYLTAGQYKGSIIQTPKNVKPTLSKVRESVFNILAPYQKTTFLDMFAGSGIMGLEAISRGYIVKAIEKNPKNANIIKQNYKKLKLTPELFVCDAMSFKEEGFDIVYLDPPWEDDYQKIIRKAKTLINQEGIIVVELDGLLNIDIEKISDEEELDIIKEKKYGRARIYLLVNC